MQNTALDSQLFHISPVSLIFSLSPYSLSLSLLFSLLFSLSLSPFSSDSYLPLYFSTSLSSVSRLIQHPVITDSSSSVCAWFLVLCALFFPLDRKY